MACEYRTEIRLWAGNIEVHVYIKKPETKSVNEENGLSKFSTIH